MRVSILIGTVTLTLFICYPSGLFAQEEPKEKKAEVGKKKPEETKKKEEAKEEVIRVEEVTVEAAPFKRPLKQHPGSATLIDRTEIEETGATYTTEVLRRVPGINIQDEDGRGLKPDIGIRGLDPGRSRNVLILRDGVPVQPAMYGDPSTYYSVPIENLESIEIIKGASSVLYGTNSVGGVVNYITRPLPPRPTLIARQTFGSNNLWVSDVGYGGRWNNVGLWGSFLRKQGDGFRERLGFDVSDASLRAELDLTASSRMVFNLNYYKEQSETPGGLTSAQFREDLTQSQRSFDLFEGQRFSGDLSYTHSVTPNFAYQALIYGNFFERNFTIRGFRASSDIFLDGVRDDGDYFRDLSNIDRIEVLKGPAAVLYGRGSSGGIVNFVTRKPQAEPVRELEFNYGSFDLKRGSADVAGPLLGSQTLTFPIDRRRRILREPPGRLLSGPLYGRAGAFLATHGSDPGPAPGRVSG